MNDVLRIAEQALQYIARPTMGLPGDRDAEEFVDEASEANVRLALKTCIRTARVARMKLLAADVAENCTCGFGGFHDDINPNCDANRSTE